MNQIIITSDPKVLYKTKAGKELKNPLILFNAEQYGVKSISYFLEREDDSMWKLKKGDSIPDYVVESGEYLNYRIPAGKSVSVVEQKLDLIIDMVMQVITTLRDDKKEAIKEVPTKIPIIDDEDPLEMKDIPL